MTLGTATVDSTARRFRSAHTFAPLPMPNLSDRPEPNPAADPTATELAGRMLNDIVRPLLRTDSRESYFELVSDKLGEFIELARALRVVKEKKGDSRSIAPEAFERACRDVRVLGGEHAEEEFRFDILAIKKATRLISQLSGREPRDLDADSGLLEEFQVQSALYAVGITAIVEASRNGGHTGCALDLSFEIARGGALRTYAAVRNAIRLRTEPVNVEMGTGDEFDREDAHLAGLDS